MLSVCSKRLLLLALMFGCAALETPLNGSATALGSDSTMSYDQGKPLLTLPEQQEDDDSEQGKDGVINPRGAGASFLPPSYYTQEYLARFGSRHDSSRPSNKPKRPRPTPRPVAVSKKKNATRVGHGSRPSKTRKKPGTTSKKVQYVVGRGFRPRALSRDEADHRDRTFNNATFNNDTEGKFFSDPSKNHEPDKSRGLTYTYPSGHSAGAMGMGFQPGEIKGFPLPPEYVPHYLPRNIEPIRVFGRHIPPNIPRERDMIPPYADDGVSGPGVDIVSDVKAPNVQERYISINITKSTKISPEQSESNLRWRNLSEEARQFLTGSLSTAIIPSFYTLVCLISVPINICALLVFIKRIKPKHPAVIYMMNLACADLLFSIVLPFKISYHFNGNDWVFGPAMCRIVTAAFYWNMYCSVLLISLISVDRFLAVVYPVQSLSWRSPAKAVVACAAMWVLSFVGSMHLLFTEQTFNLKELSITTCHDVQPSQLFLCYKMYYVTLCLLLFFLPLVITMVSYTRVILTLSKVKPGVPDSSQKKKRAVLLTATVLVMFVVCFLPTNIVYIVHQLMYSEETKGHEKEMNPDRLYVIYLVCLCLGSLNCVLDPLVYYFGSSQFQKELSSMMGCLKTKESTSSGQPSSSSGPSNSSSSTSKSP